MYVNHLQEAMPIAQARVTLICNDRSHAAYTARYTTETNHTNYVWRHITNNVCSGSTRFLCEEPGGQDVCKEGILPHSFPFPSFSIVG